MIEPFFFDASSLLFVCPIIPSSHVLCYNGAAVCFSGKLTK